MNGLTNRHVLFIVLAFSLVSTLTAAGIFARERFGGGDEREVAQRILQLEQRLASLEEGGASTDVLPLSRIEGRLDGFGRELDGLAVLLRRELAGQRKDLEALGEGLLLLRESEGEQRRLLDGNLDSLGRGLEELEGLEHRLRALVDALPGEGRAVEAGYPAGGDGR